MFRAAIGGTEGRQRLPLHLGFWQTGEVSADVDLVYLYVTGEQIARERFILRRVPDHQGRPMYTEERLFSYLQQFERDFVKTKVPDDDIEIARQNNSAAKRRALMQTTPSDGAGATAMQFRNMAQKASYTGQVPPMNIFNPAAWSEFIQAWKRGDYKRK